MSFYSTKQVADAVGMRVSQIQYYDSLGLIPNLHRNKNGYREFSDENVTWLKDLKVFVSSGMPLKEVQQLTLLVKQGKTATIEERRKIIADQIHGLETKRADIDQQINFLTNFLS